VKMNNQLTKTLVFSFVMIVTVVCILAGLIVLARPYLEERYRPLLVQYLASSLPVEEKIKIYHQIGSETPSLWDTLPEPLVGRIAKANFDTVISEARVKTNNAGMRASHPYLMKSPNVYRIVCLGDSYVFGEAGNEEDRWCDQMQQWFDRTGTRIEGKPVETLAIGLGSWTLLQEASYLTSRLTDYDPDLIIVLTVPNDITDDSGVTGAGVLTDNYSNSQRRWGSGVLSNTAGVEFGVRAYTAMMYGDLSTTTRDYWATGMASLKRLSELQGKRNGKIFFSVLNEQGKRVEYFESIYRQQFARAGIAAPMFSVTYLRSAETMLPHDAHPNKKGHALLAAQYLYAMKKAGLLDQKINNLPALDNSLEPRFNEPVDDVAIQNLRSDFIKRVPESIDFSVLKKESIGVFMGGILPERSSVLSNPWASVRAGFLIKSPSRNAHQFVLDIDIPDRTELFPLQVTVKLQGKLEKHFVFNRNGKEKLNLDVPADLVKLPVLEVMLESDHYFTQIEDQRMKVFQLLSAHWE